MGLCGLMVTFWYVIQAPNPKPQIMRYELTDYERVAIMPFLPNKPRGVPRGNDRRALNGIFWVRTAKSYLNWFIKAEVIRFDQYPAQPARAGSRRQRWLYGAVLLRLRGRVRRVAGVQPDTRRTGISTQRARGAAARRSAVETGAAGNVPPASPRGDKAYQARSARFFNTTSLFPGRECVRQEKWPGAAFVARTDLVAIGGKADATGSRANVAIDPSATSATKKCCDAQRDRHARMR